LNRQLGEPLCGCHEPPLQEPNPEPRAGDEAGAVLEDLTHLLGEDREQLLACDEDLDLEVATLDRELERAALILHELEPTPEVQPFGCEAPRLRRRLQRCGWKQLPSRAHERTGRRNR
jgi:hypothetical protein